MGPKDANLFNQYGLLYEYCVSMIFYQGVAQYDAIKADAITSTKYQICGPGQWNVLFSIIFSVLYQATIKSRSGRDYAISLCSSDCEYWTITI